MRNAARTMLMILVLLVLALVRHGGLGASDSGTDDPQAEERPPLADVVLATVKTDSGTVELEVGVQSPDTGCDQYADWWEVVGTDGRLIYRRILRHSHVDEQPFIRSGGPVEVDPDRTVWIRAHMHPTGYGGHSMTGTMNKGFVVAQPQAGFAAALAEMPPLPDGCAF